MVQKFKVLIVGAGNIGAFYDDPSSKLFLTHAHAFSQNEFILIGFVDADFKKAVKASHIWGGSPFKTIDEAFIQHKIDIVCEAVNDENHFEVLKELAYVNLRLVFAEKPLTTSLTQAKSILDLYKKKELAIAVNYTRRYIPEFENLKSEISNFGKFISGSGFYGKGLIHNGSHLIDLIRYLVGEIQEFKVFEEVFDYTKGDPSVSAVIKLENKLCFLIKAIDSSLYSVFEMDLLFEKARIKIDDSRFVIEEFRIGENKIFNGYKNLKKIREIKTSQDKSTKFAAKNIYEFLTGKNNLKCSGNEAFKTLQACFKAQ